MARTVRCPQCNARNKVPAGTVGLNCQRCGAPFRVKAEAIQTSSWQPSGGNFFERLEQTFSQPKGIVLGSLALLLLFIGFWGLLHWELSSPKPPAPSPPVAVNQIDHQLDTAPPPAPAPTPAPYVAPPPSRIAPAPSSTQPQIARPVPHPLPELVNPITDRKIKEAITRGVNYLIGRFDPDTHMVKIDEPSYANGGDMLCVYSLLQCNDAISDPRLSPTSPFMQGVLEAMISAHMDAKDEIYGRSLRANALALVDLPADRKALERDVIWLGRAERLGAYDYGMPTTPPNQPLDWDNSNSQYGVLGVWAGAEVGMPIPSYYWQAVQKHWVDCQLSDGSFEYKPGQGGKLTMTVAGVASLCIAHDYLAGSSATGVESRSPALVRALKWLDTGDNAVTINPNGPHFAAYGLYGVARAGLASGYKFFGKHDWYTELARDPLKSQADNGSINNDPIDTAFTLLFLARGLHPVFFNKLNVDGVLMSHPRDVANLSRYASRELENTFNAQIVPASHDWLDWTDSPVLYLAAASAPDLSDHQCDQIRSFVQAGGMLFTNADYGSAAFNQFAGQLAQRLFPDYPLKNLPADHPLYSALFRLHPPPPLKAVTNGARLLMVHSPIDVARSWDIHDWNLATPAYQLGVNLFIYEAGTRDFRNRLDTNYVAAPTDAPVVTLPVARLRYAGNWDPEPYAWTRFSRQFQWQTSFAVDLHAIDIASLTPASAPVAALTGVDAHQFTADEVVALQQYVQRGGVLLIDSCGGAAAFASAQQALLSAAFPQVQSAPLDPAHPLLAGTGDCMDPLPHVAPRIVGSSLQAPAILRFGRGHVIVTPADLTCGLLNTDTLGIKGYQPEYAESFIKNLMLWAWNNQPDQ
jgi:hypothetical protein